MLRGLLAALLVVAAGDEAPRIDDLLARAEAHDSPQRRRADLAVPLFREAAALAEAQGDTRRAARAWLGLGRSLRSTHQPAEARAAAERARAAFAASRDTSGEGEALRLAAVLHTEAGGFETGDRLLESVLGLAERTGDSALRIRARNAQAASARRPGRLLDSIGHARLALQELDSERARGAALADEALFAVPYNLGSSLLESGDYRGAILLLERALAAADAAGNLAGRWHVLQDSAEWYAAQGEPGKAAAYYERALLTARRIESRDPEALTLRGLASLAEARGDWSEARKRYEQALAIFEGISFGGELPATLVALARVEARLGETEASRARLDRAVSLAGRTGNPLAAVLAHLERARQDEALGRVGPAAEGYRIALATARGNGLRPMEPVALVGLARLLRREGDPEPALRRYQEAADAVEAMRARMPSVGLRAAFASAAHDTYEALLALTLQASDPGHALLVLERERSHALAEDLRQTGADAASSREARELQRRVSAIQLRLAAPETAAAERPALLARLDDAERALDALEGQTRRSAPGSAPVDATKLRAALKEGELFVAYAPLPGGMAAFAVTRSALRVVRLETSSGLDARLDLYLGLLAGPSPEDALPVGRALSRELLAPVLAGHSAGSRRLIVAASGALAALPFAALPDPERPEAPLVARLSIAYAPSLSWLLRLRSLPASSGKGVLAVAGDAPEPELVVAGRRRTLGLLPGARREIEAIAFRAAPVERRSGAEAQEAALRAGSLRGFSVLHFAAHSLDDPLSPSRSALLLRPGGGEDGWLQPREIYGLDLDADLVVLSGCGTAAGRRSRAEGTQSLSGAFLEAGARAVAGTAWSVEDEVTSRLVDTVYARLAAGDDVGDALAGAERAALGPRPWLRASDWAGFMLHGDPGARPRLDPPPPRLRADARVALAALAAAAAAAAMIRARQR